MEETQPVVNPNIPPEIQVNPTKPWLKIVAFSLLGLFLAGGLVWAGYQLGKNSNLKTSRGTGQNLAPAPIPVVTSQPTFPSEPTSSPSPSEAPAKVGDETAGWKSYRNRKCGYEVKYPSSWGLIPEAEDAVYGAAVIFPYEVGSGIKPPADWLKVQIGCAKKEIGVDPKDVIERLNRRDTGYGVSKIEGLEQIDLNGNIAFRQVNIPPVGSSVLEYYIFPVGNKYYSLGFTPAETGLKTTIDQILSTFKFLD